MNSEKKKDLIRALWVRYGKKNQLMKAVEEMAELQKELMKALSLMEQGKEVPVEIIRAIAEEKEDVKFMMEQLDFMYVGPDDLRMNAKLDKLANRYVDKEHGPTKEESLIEESMVEFFKTRYQAPRAGEKFWDDLRKLSNINPHICKTPTEVIETMEKGSVSKSVGNELILHHKIEIDGYWILIDPQMPRSKIKEKLDSLVLKLADITKNT